MAYLIISSVPLPVYLNHQFKIKNEKLKNAMAYLIISALLLPVFLIYSIIPFSAYHSYASLIASSTDVG